MTVRLWDYAAPEDALLAVWDHHTEFAVGLDMSLLQVGRGFPFASGCVAPRWRQGRGAAVGPQHADGPTSTAPQQHCASDWQQQHPPTPRRPPGGPHGQQRLG